MANILAIETSTRFCSVSILKDSKIFSKEKLEERYTHAELLHKFIEEIIAEAGLEFSELDAIAVSKGPGSYTGLRIGVSAAKGLAYSLNIPLIGVDTLKTMALEVSLKNLGHTYLIPMLDARRMEVYCAIYTVDLQEYKSVHALEITSGSFSQIKESAVVFGDGAQKVIDNFPEFEFFIVEDIWPRSEYTAKIALDRYVDKDFDNTAYFEPFYLKDFIAGKPRDILRD